MFNKIKIFPEGTSEIKVEDVPEDTELIVLPHSITHIEDGWFKGNGRLCDTVYVGSMEDFKRIDYSNDIFLREVICTDGSILLHL